MSAAIDMTDIENTASTADEQPMTIHDFVVNELFKYKWDDFKVLASQVMKDEQTPLTERVKVCLLIAEEYRNERRWIDHVTALKNNRANGAGTNSGANRRIVS